MVTLVKQGNEEEAPWGGSSQGRAPRGDRAGDGEWSCGDPEEALERLSFLREAPDTSTVPKFMMSSHSLGTNPSEPTGPLR